MEPAELRAVLLSEHRKRRLDLMASFCRFWGMTPSEYKALTVEELNAMTEFANDEIKARNKANRRR